MSTTDIGRWVFLTGVCVCLFGFMLVSRAAYAAERPARALADWPKVATP